MTLKIGKEAFYRQAEMALAEAYDYAAEVMVENMLARDAEEGIGAFLGKRQPEWTGEWRGAAAWNHDGYDNAYISGILNGVRTIAMVGASANDVRPSYFVLKYLLAKGFAVFPINPARPARKSSAA